MIAYLFTPYFAPLCGKLAFDKNLMVLLGIVVFSIPFIGTTHPLIMFSRFPVYYIGMIFAKYRQKTIRTKHFILLVAFSALGSVAIALSRLLLPENTVGDYGLYWYPVIIAVPGIVIVIGRIGEFFKRYLAVAEKGVSFIGGISFEIYLVHTLLYKFLKFLQAEGNITMTNTMWWISFPLIIVISWLYSIFIKKITSLRIN